MSNPRPSAAPCPARPRPGRRRALIALLPLLAAGCALSPLADPPRVQLVGVDPLPGEGLEWRGMVRLRVQNPNGHEIAFDGVALTLHLRGKPFASGVAPVAGQVPRFGETVLSVPVTVSGLSVARQLIGLTRDGVPGKVGYAISGKLGTGLGAVRFESRGEIDLAL